MKIITLIDSNHFIFFITQLAPFTADSVLFAQFHLENHLNPWKTKERKQS